MTQHEVLGKRLGRLELRCAAVWTPDSETCSLKVVDDTQGERAVWSDDGEIDLMSDRMVAKSVQGICGNRNIGRRIS
jgi:hypothetical protein